MKSIYTVVISTCSVEAAKNIEKIILTESFKYCSTNKVVLQAGVEIMKTKDGADLRFNCSDGNFMFHVGIEIGLKMETICPHNAKHKQYDYSRN
jgi:hypothetical protein